MGNHPVGDEEAQVSDDISKSRKPVALRSIHQKLLNVRIELGERAPLFKLMSQYLGTSQR